MNGHDSAMITPAGSTIVSGGGGYPNGGGYGYGGGFGGFGAGLFGGILGGALVGRGFGHDGGHCCNSGLQGVGFLSNQISDSTNSINDNLLTGFTNANITSTLSSIQNGQFATALQIANEGRATDKSICDLGANLTTQNIATNANINAVERTTALGFAATAKDICDTNHNIDKSTTATLMAINASTQAIKDQLCADREQALRDQLAAANLENAFNSRGLFEGSGPVITAHEACHKREGADINLALLLAQQQANQIAINTGTLANAGIMGQGLGQGIGQGALQK